MKSWIPLWTMLSFAATAHAQASPENTRAACTDHLDNDGDGHIDCDDQDCQDFTFCATNPGARTEHTDLPKLRSRGTVFVVVGAILISLGIVVGAASAPLWIADTHSLSDNASQQAAVAMDVVGVAMLGAGIPLLAIGAGKLAEARRPRLALWPTSLAVHF